MRKHVDIMGNEIRQVEVHYAKIDLGNEDIPVTTIPFGEGEFISDWDDVVNSIRSLIEISHQKSKKVFLVAMEESYIDHVFISDMVDAAVDFIARIGEDYPTKIFIQEYASYEEAYEVALMMKEESELCYDKTKIN